MGSLESKVKQGYSVKQRPLFKAKMKNGIKPILSNQNSRKSPSPLKSGYLNPKISFGPLRHSALINDTENQEADIPKQKNSPAYPCTAIGVICSPISGSFRRSTGALISSNVVLTAAYNLFCMDSQLQASSATFRVSCMLGQWEQHKVQKVIIPQQFKNGMRDNMSTKDLSLHDYGILVLSTHVNVEKFGTLGFNFDFPAKENCENLAIYGYHKQYGGLQEEGQKIKASVGEKVIKYCTNATIETIGAPIIEFKDQNFTIIGLQNGVYRQKHLYQKKALKLRSEMFDRMSQWVTHEEEEIDLRDKEFGKQGIKILVKFKWTSLSSINIARNSLGSEGLKYLTRCQWNNLYHLDIGGNDIRKQGVKYLVGISMKNLQSLNMWGNGIESDGALILLDGDWKQLNCMNLYNNQLDNQGLRYIAKGNWIELQSINLGKNKITDPGMRFLMYSIWRNVVSLNLWGNILKDPKTLSSELKKHFTKIKYLYL